LALMPFLPKKSPLTLSANNFLWFQNLIHFYLTSLPREKICSKSLSLLVKFANNKT
jgi:hypothetical protein